jgi:hypothetical protein
MCQQNTTKIRPERGVQLFGQSYQKITMDLVGEIKSDWPLVYPRVLVVQEALRTVIIAPYRKAILVLCRFCRCVVGTRDPGRCVHDIHIELQPKKSVAIHMRGNNKQCETTNEKLNMGNITMLEVEQATHLGIIRTTTMKHNILLLLVESS